MKLDRSDEASFWSTSCLGEELGFDPARGKASKAKREDFRGRSAFCPQRVHVFCSWWEPRGTERGTRAQEQTTEVCAFALASFTLSSSLRWYPDATASSRAVQGTEPMPHHASVLLPWFSAEYKQKWGARVEMFNSS